MQDDVTLNEVDELFETSKPGYYKFTPEPYHQTCIICDKKFTSHLSLLRFCSPEHQEMVMVQIAKVKRG